MDIASACVSCGRSEARATPDQPYLSNPAQDFLVALEEWKKDKLGQRKRVYVFHRVNDRWMLQGLCTMSAEVLQE